MTVKKVKKKKINACRKGKGGERELVNWLKDRGILSARRTQQHNGNDGKSDVVAPTELPHWHIESKRMGGTKINLCILKEWAAQLVRDCEDGQHPVLFFRGNRGKMLTFFFLDVIKKLFLNNTAILVSSGKSFEPQKILSDAKLSQRIYTRIYGVTKKSDIVAVFEIEPGLEFYAMDGDDALAQMLMLQSTYGKESNKLPRPNTISTDTEATQA